ncbi:MAG TPA: RidA family protein [Burkholderiales bacterium]
MSARRVVVSQRVARQTLPISSAVIAGDLVFLSGHVGFRKDRSFAKGDFRAQARQALENIKTVLEDCGTSLERVVKVNVVITRVEDFAAFNEIYREYFGEGNYPARATHVAGLVNPDLLVEVECVAQLPSHG